VIIFKTDINTELLNADGYEVISLTRNPHLSDSNI
jgi:hypothetical protein